MDLTGLIDYDAEIKKLEKALSKTTPSLEQLEKKMSAPGYAEKVSEVVKKANLERLDGLKKKAVETQSAIDNFKRLKGLETK